MHLRAELGRVLCFRLDRVFLEYERVESMQVVRTVGHADGISLKWGGDWQWWQQQFFGHSLYTYPIIVVVTSLPLRYLRLACCLEFIDFLPSGKGELVCEVQAKCLIELTLHNTTIYGNRAGIVLGVCSLYHKHWSTCHDLICQCQQSIVP